MTGAWRRTVRTKVVTTVSRMAELDLEEEESKRVVSPRVRLVAYARFIHDRTLEREDPRDGSRQVCF